MMKRCNEMKKILIRNMELLIYVCFILVDMLNLPLRNIKTAVFIDAILVLSLFLLEVQCVFKQKKGEASFIRIPFSILNFYNNRVVWKEFGVRLFSLKSIYIMAIIEFGFRIWEMVVFRNQRKKNHDKNLVPSIACELLSFSHLLSIRG